MHVLCEPNILYFGTPVVLISTVNEDGSPNLAPMSSAFWLGWRCMLGLTASSKTVENIRRTRECVLNLPSQEMVDAVNCLVRTTGSNPVPPDKVSRGYRFEREKFGIAGLTGIPSLTVEPPRVAECPVHLEAKVEAIHGVADDDSQQRGKTNCIECRIQRVHADERILASGQSNRIDPEKWRPLLMSFMQFYGLGMQFPGSKLAEIPQSLYRVPDIDNARNAHRDLG